MEPNKEQIKSAIRWVIATFGGMLVGWGVARGKDMSWLTALFQSEAIIGLVASGIMLVWSMVTNTKTGVLKTAVEVVPEVKKIEIVPVSQAAADQREAGRIVASTPPTVVASGKL